MTIYLYDTFTGAGTADGHAPDTTQIGPTWVATYGPGMTLDSGSILGGGSVQNDMSVMTLTTTGGEAEPALSGPQTELQITFSFRTGSNTAVWATDTRYALGIELRLGGLTSTAIWLWADADGGWNLDNEIYDGTPVSVSLANDTTYTGTATIYAGEITIDFLGVTLTRTISPSATALYPTQTDVTLGYGYSLLSPLEIVASMSEPAGTGSSAIDLPLLAVGAAGRDGAKASLALPSLSATAQGHDSTGERAADITLPSLTASAQGGANARISLPSFTSQAAGTVTAAASTNISLPSLNAAANATASEVGSANITLPSMSGKSYAGALCSVTIGKLTAQATGTTGSIGGAQITLPLFQATAIATSGNHGYADIVLPSLSMHSGGNGVAANLPSLQLAAIGTAVITATYEAYAVNLKHNPRPNVEPIDETTRYTNFPFTHVVRYLNSYFGVNSTGLYLLEGTTDDAAPISYSVKTKLTDFGTDQMKTPEAAVFGGRLGPDATVTVYTGETEDDVYAYTTPRGQVAQNYRQKFGKGLKARYYAFGIQGDGAMAIDTVSFDLATLKRRI